MNALRLASRLAAPRATAAIRQQPKATGEFGRKSSTGWGNVSSTLCNTTEVGFGLPPYTGIARATDSNYLTFWTDLPAWTVVASILVCLQSDLMATTHSSTQSPADFECLFNEVPGASRVR